MPNPASIDIGEVKYSIENTHLFRFVERQHTKIYDLTKLKVKVTANLNDQQVKSLTITALNGDQIVIHNEDIDRGNLTEFYQILDERIAVLTNK